MKQQIISQIEQLLIERREFIFGALSLLALVVGGCIRLKILAMQQRLKPFHNACPILQIAQNDDFCT